MQYVDARKQIYVPSFRWVLENQVADDVKDLAEQARSHTLVLLDYETNLDVEDSSKPLSHAGLVKALHSSNIEMDVSPMKGLRNGFRGTSQLVEMSSGA